MSDERFIPLEIVNPSTGCKIPETLHNIWPSCTKFGQPVPKFNQEKILKRLQEIRKYTVDNLPLLIQKLKETMERYPEVDFILASDAKEAVTALKRFCDSCNKVSVNKSNAVEELKDQLVEQGFEIEETYYQEFKGFAPLKEKRPYWQLPEITPEIKWRSFISVPFSWGEQEKRWESAKGKVVLFGINAISAEDGTVLFLEHSRNITQGLREASHVILLAGLEKVVQNREDALFQTICTGLFGFEAIASELKLKSERSRLAVDQHGGQNPRVSIILLDNGRSVIREKFKEFLYCIGCRTCNAVCPSFFIYENIFEGPRNWLKMFNEVYRNSPKVATGEETIWSCRTCKLCEDRCPLEIRHIDKFIRLREHLVETGKISTSLRDALDSTFLHGNPWGLPRSKRDKWTKGLNVEKFDGHDILYFVGCMPSYDQRCQEIAKSISGIFKTAGVSFGILGKRETHCGAEIKRIGERGLFEELVDQNKECFKKTGAKKIVTSSPHCFHTFRNEYNGNFKVLHYTQFLADNINKVELKNELSYKVTYHDPCYLGRYNGIYEEPRKILKTLPGVRVVEMEANRENSFCCGGGGGHLWIDWLRRPRPSEIRLKQAIETGADTLAVACPFCLSMFDDAIKTLGCEDKIRVKDISELIIEAIV